VKGDPKLALGYQYLGYAERQTGKHDEALADFSRAIELDPNNAITRFARAQMYAMNGGDQDKITTDLRAAIAADPNFAPAYGMLAVYMAENRENLPEALSLAKKATNLEPGNSTYQFDMAEVLLVMNRIADARTVATAARKNAIYPGQRRQAEQFLQSLDTIGNSANAEENRSGGAETGGTVPAAGSAGAKADGATAATMPATNVREATGLVSKVDCSNGLHMELKTDSGTLQLRVRPGGQTKVEADAPPMQGEFNLCSVLPGKKIGVEYKPDDEKTNSGELVKVRLTNPQ